MDQKKPWPVTGKRMRRRQDMRSAPVGPAGGVRNVHTEQAVSRRGQPVVHVTGLAPERNLKLHILKQPERAVHSFHLEWRATRLRSPMAPSGGLGHSVRNGVRKAKSGVRHRHRSMVRRTGNESPLQVLPRRLEILTLTQPSWKTLPWLASLKTEASLHPAAGTEFPSSRRTLDPQAQHPAAHHTPARAVKPL